MGEKVNFKGIEKVGVTSEELNNSLALLSETVYKVTENNPHLKREMTRNANKRRRWRVRNESSELYSHTKKA